MKRLLPIGIQDFISIRKDNFCYVDKTAFIHQLITGSGKYFFLSRPRRFGKSLLCSTLGLIFDGSKDLFDETDGRQALAISGLEWEWKKHPVIRIDLNPGNYTNGTDVLRSGLHNSLDNTARNYNINLRGKELSEKFFNLIRDLSATFKERCVVIIDEYDKPLLNTMDDKELHIAMRNELKGFYGVLKSSDKDLRFVFLTGVSKFSHVSVFSDLNNILDISLDPRYATICGLTQEEIEQNFAPEIETALENSGRSRDEYKERLRQYYNGYRFSKNPVSVYNPFGLLKHFDKSGDFSPYWYESGTPTMLINLITKQKINILDLTNMQVDYGDFCKYDIETMRAPPLLYQTGYLTIKDYDEELDIFSLDYPNDEVRSCFSKSLMEQYLSASDEAPNSLNYKLRSALIKGEMEEAMNALKTFLASIPYDIIKDSENYYQTALHLIFSMVGLNCRSEVRIAAGRIDTLVETKNFVYCFEFKIDGTAEEALAQIDTKDYLLPWNGSGKKLFKIGVSFDREKRNIGDWKSVTC